MSDVREPVLTRPLPWCRCERYLSSLYSALCDECLRKNALAFWRFMGLPGIPGSSSATAVAEQHQHVN